MLHIAFQLINKYVYMYKSLLILQCKLISLEIAAVYQFVSSVIQSRCLNCLSLSYLFSNGNPCVKAMFTQNARRKLLFCLAIVLPCNEFQICFLIYCRCIGIDAMVQSEEIIRKSNVFFRSSTFSHFYTLVSDKYLCQIT